VWTGGSYRSGVSVMRKMSQPVVMKMKIGGNIPSETYVGRPTNAIRVTS
jgi:hypothetical protein